MDSLQEQRLMCSYYAGRKHSLHRNVTYSMTNETAEALNLARSSQRLGQSQPLACTGRTWVSEQVADIKGQKEQRWASVSDGAVPFPLLSTARGRVLWVSSVVIPSIWRHAVTSSGTCCLLKSGSDH